MGFENAKIKLDKRRYKLPFPLDGARVVKEIRDLGDVAGKVDELRIEPYSLLERLKGKYWGYVVDRGEEELFYQEYNRTAESRREGKGKKIYGVLKIYEILINNKEKD